MRRPFVISALVSLLIGCGAAAPAPEAARVYRYEALVESTVLRTLTTEGGVALDEGSLAAVRREAVREIAAALDAMAEPDVADLRLDVNLAELRSTPRGTRARCLITISTAGPPERTRSMLQGAATVPAHATPEVAAAQGAIRAALRGLPQALAAL
ncbi:MAG: hypothetical protein VYE22_39695 [Myxococcota bacterium]|nr:hypothetical protein [Myxococcota bacterium]